MLTTERVASEITSGDLADVLEQGPVQASPRFGNILQALAGQGGDGEFRVPAADTGNELFFNNRELLARFTSMPLPTQRDLLKSVRATMADQGTNTLHMTIQWSARKTRVVKIRKINREGCLNIYL